MKIYTKTGDEGTTGLVGGSRVAKDDLRIEAIGSVDELNAAIGFCRASGLSDDLEAVLAAAQSHLFDVGAELATPANAKFRNDSFQEEATERLEQSIDALTAAMPPLTHFVLPGGSESAARLHLARVACRRCERTVLTFHGQAEVRGVILAYLNRLSDWLFVASRTANMRANVEDVIWGGNPI